MRTRRELGDHVDLVDFGFIEGSKNITTYNARRVSWLIISCFDSDNQNRLFPRHHSEVAFTIGVLGPIRIKIRVLFDLDFLSRWKVNSIAVQKCASNSHGRRPTYKLLAMEFASKGCNLYRLPTNWKVMARDAVVVDRMQLTLKLLAVLLPIARDAQVGTSIHGARFRLGTKTTMIISIAKVL